MPKTLDYAQLLKAHFNLDGFRRGQLEVIEAILQGEDILCVMPTGYGKSLCYQFPSVVSDGVTVIVSPLVALMKDQVDALRSSGFEEVTFINSSIAVDEQKLRLARLKEGYYKLVYISPERFRSRGFLNSLKKLKLSLFVIDEVHCISEWGHDFRPDYLALSNVIQQLGRPQVAAFTATATEEVRGDIKRHLGVPGMREFVNSIERPNLAFRVFPVTGDEEKLLWIKYIIQSRCQEQNLRTFCDDSMDRRCRYGTQSDRRGIVKSSSGCGVRAEEWDDEHSSGCPPDGRAVACLEISKCRRECNGQ